MYHGAVFYNLLGNAMNIIELAERAGFVEYELDDGTTEAFDKRYARFAALVAAQEREAIAQMFDNPNIWDEEISQTIRARGTA